MAEFKYYNHDLKISSTYAPYIVTGKITEDDVEMLNNSGNQKILIMLNTAGQDSKIISKISKNKAIFSILGGLDYLKISKYRDPYYIKRTIMSPLVLSSIIKQFEQIESKIRPTWDDTEKSLFVYKTMTKMYHYRYEGESKYEQIDGNTYEVIRSLSGMLYNRLVCVGFALAFKEEMDRLGIPCYYQNKRNHHAWNIVKLDGEYRGIDLTWECFNKKNNRCTFRCFGRDPKFYENKHHNLNEEQEEINFTLTPFTDEELKSHLQNVSEELTKTFSLKTFENSEGKKIKYYITEVGDKYTKYYIDLFGKLVVVYLPNQILPKDGLTISNIEKAITNEGYIGPKPAEAKTKYNLFTRTDGTSFLITPSDRKKKNLGEFCYLDIIQNSQGEDVIRRSFILSENDLTKFKNESQKELIASTLLSSKRLEKKLMSFNGYVGYIGDDFQIYYDKTIETSLNIQGRRR